MMIRMQTTTRIALITFSAILLSGCTLSLAGDVTPPANSQSGGPSSVGVSVPAFQADPQEGAIIYAENCASCHGPQGLGDGEDAKGSPAPVAAIGTSRISMKARPGEWFQTITEGHIAQGMPSFRTLNDQQRWNVVAYVFTLSMTEEGYLSGKSIYEKECKSCHGPDGRGLSTATNPTRDWSDPKLLAGVTNADISNAISSGFPPKMMGYADRLSEAERGYLTDFIRTLAFANFNPGEQTGEVPGNSNILSTPLPQVFQINGQVIVPAGQPVPGELNLTLHGYDEMEEAFAYPLKTEPNGRFLFKDIRLKNGRVFMVTVEYNDLMFNSDFLAADELTAGETINLPIKVYPASSNIASLSAERFHIILDFTDPGRMRVGEIIVLSNTGEQVILPRKDGKPAFQISLPPLATNLLIEETSGPQYLVEQNNNLGYFGPIEPGSSHQIIFSYELPFNGDAKLNLALPLPVNNAVVMVTDEQITVSSKTLNFSGTRSIQGINVKIYNALNLPAGDVLSMRIFSPVSYIPVLIAGLTISIVLSAAIVYFIRKKRKAAALAQLTSGIEEASNQLLDAMIALDDQYKAGQISANAYQLRRAELKQFLYDILQDSHEPNHPG